MKWIYDDEVIATNATLFIQDVKVADQGDYICNGTNQYGTDNMMIHLNVLS